MRRRLDGSMRCRVEALTSWCVDTSRIDGQCDKIFLPGDFADEVFANKIFANNIFAYDILADEIFTNEISADKIFANEIFADSSGSK